MTLGFSSRAGKDRTSKDAYNDNDSSRRSVEKRSRRESLDEGYRYSHVPRLPRISREEAIDSLFDSVQGFWSYLTNLKEGFERDVRRVKPYVDTKDLATLWEAKVDDTDGHYYSQSIDYDLISDAGYRTRRKRFIKCLHLARETVESSKADRDVVLKDKLKSTEEEMMRRLHEAAHKYASVDHLLTDLELLTVLLERNGGRMRKTYEPHRDGSQRSKERSEVRLITYPENGRDETRVRRHSVRDPGHQAPFKPARSQPMPMPKTNGDRGRHRDGDDPGTCQSPALYRSDGYRFADGYRRSGSLRRQSDDEETGWDQGGDWYDVGSESSSTKNPKVVLQPKLKPDDHGENSWRANYHDPFDCPTNTHDDFGGRERRGRRDDGHTPREFPASYESRDSDGEGRHCSSDPHRQSEGLERGQQMNILHDTAGYGEWSKQKPMPISENVFRQGSYKIRASPDVHRSPRSRNDDGQLRLAPNSGRQRSWSNNAPPSYRSGGNEEGQNIQGSEIPHCKEEDQGEHWEGEHWDGEHKGKEGEKKHCECPEGFEERRQKESGADGGEGLEGGEGTCCGEGAHVGEGAEGRKTPDGGEHPHGASNVGGADGNR